MKEYKLTAWPDLPTEYRRTAYRRMVSELSQRHVSEAHLHKCSGVSNAEVRSLLNHLQSAGQLDTRDAEPVKPVGWRQAWPMQFLLRLAS
jgi:hypothetical protein